MSETLPAHVPPELVVDFDFYRASLAFGLCRNYSNE